MRDENNRILGAGQLTASQVDLRIDERKFCRSQAIAAQHAGRVGAVQRKEQGRQQQEAASGLQVAARRLQEGRLVGLGAADWPRGGMQGSKGGGRGCRGGEQGSRGGGRAARGDARGLGLTGGPAGVARGPQGAARGAARATRGLQRRRAGRKGRHAGLLGRRAGQQGGAQGLG
ncbi:unnamed protein product, partial [Closterium sp. NIES-53]